MASTDDERVTSRSLAIPVSYPPPRLGVDQASDRWHVRAIRRRFIGSSVVVDGEVRTITSASQAVVRVERQPMAPTALPLEVLAEAAWMIPAMERAVDANGERLVQTGAEARSTDGTR